MQGPSAPRTATPLARILVVDDNELNVALVRMLLAPVAIEGVGSASQARAAIARAKPQLILMDLELPDTNGLILTRQLRADPSLRHVPIVVVTAHSAADVEAAVRAAGCAGLITKPLDPLTFRDTVVGYLAAEIRNAADHLQDA